MGKRGGNKKKKQIKQLPQDDPVERAPQIVEEINDSDDEEISEDDAFNSEDERLYGHFFADKQDHVKRKSKGLDSSDDDDEEVTSGSDNENDDGEADSDDDSDDNEEDDDDDDAGQYMLELLNKLDKSPNKNDDDNENKKFSTSQMSKIPESEYSNSISKTTLTLDNLMEGIQDTQGYRELQKALSKQTSTTSTPLDKVVANRIERKLVYETQSKDISRWVQIIQENRQAETLDFKPKERIELTKDTMIDKFTPKTDFELEINQALEQAGQQDEQAILKAEEDALQDDLGSNKLTIEEYKKRRGQLAQIRALMFYHEQKRHHIKKIKSKKYRKIRKRQREKYKEAAMEAAIAEDDDLAKELKEKEEVARIQERMTLAHKNTSKWAKRILKRGKNVDVDTRRALSAQLKRGDDLRRKMMGDQPSDGSDNDGDDSDSEDLVESARKVLQDTEDASDPTHGKTGLFKLSFMQKGIQKQREQAREEARKLLGELQANEMDDYDDDMQSDEEKDESEPRKAQVTSAKEMKKVLEKGELVAASLEFGNSNTISTSGGIEIDLGTDHDVDDAEDNKGLKPTGETKATVGATGTSDYVSTIKVGRAANDKNSSLQKNKNNDVDTKKRKKNRASVAPSERTMVDNDDGVNPWMKAQDDTEGRSSNEKNNPAKKARRTGLVDVVGAVDILDAGKKDSIPLAHSAGKEDASIKKQMITALTQEELVRRAFVGQNEKEIEEEFETEKNTMVDGNDPKRKVEKEKGSDEVSGWGSWAGQGVLPPKPRKFPKKLQPPKKKEEKCKRLDDSKPGVIINQRRLKKTANNFMLGDVPYPYTTRAEYEQAMLGGIGKEWNVTNSFKNFTRPEILTRAGKIIEPISKRAKQPRPAAKF